METHIYMLIFFQCLSPPFSTHARTHARTYIYKRRERLGYIQKQIMSVKYIYKMLPASYYYYYYYLNQTEVKTH
jgi:hypothetical protein